MNPPLVYGGGLRSPTGPSEAQRKPRALRGRKVAAGGGKNGRRCTLNVRDCSGFPGGSGGNRSRIYASVAELQGDLDAWITSYNGTGRIRAAGASEKRRCHPSGKGKTDRRLSTSDRRTRPTPGADVRSSSSYYILREHGWGPPVPHGMPRRCHPKRDRWPPVQSATRIAIVPLDCSHADRVLSEPELYAP
jgi:hypothetical protein